jgi:hypothetical protein
MRLSAISSLIRRRRWFKYFGLKIQMEIESSKEAQVVILAAWGEYHEQ